MLPVSIIIPAYIKDQQGEEWLEECINSALANDCEEIIVFDDGSPYHNANIVLKYNVIYKYSNTNRGVAAARNAAVKSSTQKFIFPLDCDDQLQPGAIKKMLDVWSGKPIYSDVEKFGTTTVPHFTLLDFSCDVLIKHVGAFPVSVLHTREQYDAIGGWDETLEFYEDGEYNARLMSKYCGQRFPEPLLRYRFHDNQRTVKYKGSEGKYIKEIMPKIRRMEDMCCPGKRQTVFGGRSPFVSANIGESVMNVSSDNIQVQFDVGEIAMPLEAEGKVLARYTGGKGAGKHVYKGPKSKKPYQRVMYGDLVYAFPEDVKNPVTGENGSSFLTKIIVHTRTLPIPAKITTNENPLERTPLTYGLDRQPPEYDEEALMEITEMTVKEIMSTVSDAEVAQKLLPIEKAGKNRKMVIAHLEGLLHE